jgi:3-phosphoshikimate 1-carboxyvinyltransferase
MPLPDLIEIVPLTKTVQAQITVPGSKSITNRALILAALAKGETTLHGALWSEDTQVMVECLQKLGFSVKIAADPDEFCNCILTVQGLGGEILNAGTAEKPLELFIGNAGTAARFLSALVCLGKGVYRLHGVPRMHERPQAALFQALRELGYRVESEKGNDKLPAKIFGNEVVARRIVQPLSPKYQDSLTLSSPEQKQRTCTISIAESSQFASALMLCANTGNWKINVVGENAEESPYVVMTSKLMEAFPKKGGDFQIEPDASSGSYLLAAGRVAEPAEFPEYSEQFGIEVSTKILNSVTVENWPSSGWQMDQRFRDFLVFRDHLHALLEAEKLGESLDEKAAMDIWRNPHNQEVSRLEDLGDSIMLAIVITPLHRNKIKFTDLGRLRHQECERVVALRTELTKCGAKVIETGDTLEVFPSELHGAEIETYNDHRMAMCFAILGLKVPGIKIKNPACVKKTFPNFFQKLAATPPAGLGATILDAHTGRPLAGEELFAD